MIETITIIVLIFFIKVLIQWLFPPMPCWSDLIISTGNVKIFKNSCHSAHHHHLDHHQINNASTNITFYGNRLICGISIAYIADWVRLTTWLPFISVISSSSVRYSDSELLWLIWSIWLFVLVGYCNLCFYCLSDENWSLDTSHYINWQWIFRLYDSFGLFDYSTRWVICFWVRCQVNYISIIFKPYLI